MPTPDWSVLSERGLREKNDDATFAGTIGKYAAFIVADGLSDAAHTDAVNRAAIDALAGAVKDAAGSPQAALEAGIRAADMKVKELVREYGDPELHATKLVACLVDESLGCTAIDIGGGNCHVITKTVIEDARTAARKYRPPYPPVEQAGRKQPSLPDMISHVLGAPYRLKDTDFPAFSLGSGFLLLSSDGLTDHVPERRIAEIVRTRGKDSLDAATEALVQEAEKAGSLETITVILVHGTEP